MSYSLDTLRWGLTHCHDRDIADGKEPFSSVNLVWWERTSGHPEDQILAEMQKVKSNRLTRACPNADCVSDSYETDGK